MKKGFIIGIIMVLALLGYCRDVIFPYSWHQKMTIEVEADGQVYAGSSVVRVSWRKNDPLGAANGATWLSSLRGEAAFVEIPGRGVLFALLRTAKNSSHAENLATGIPTNRRGSPRGKEDLEIVKASLGQILTIPPSNYPLFLTFTDMSDPKTFKKVDPENLSETFGLGVLLKRLTLEITDEPVTEGKIEKFGFMKLLKAKPNLAGLEKGDENFPDPINYLNNKAFKMGVKKMSESPELMYVIFGMDAYVCMLFK